MLYANAACTKADQAGQVIAFARHWQTATGHPPSLLVFDSKVTTGAGLAELNAAGLRFITLRARNHKLTSHLEALPDSHWTTITLDRRGAHNKPQVHEHCAPPTSPRPRSDGGTDATSASSSPDPAHPTPTPPKPGADSLFGNPS